MTTNTKSDPRFKNVTDDIPPEYLITLQGQKFVKFGGLMYLIHLKGEFRVQTTCIRCSEEEVCYEAKAWLIPSDDYLASMNITKDNPCLALLMEPVVTHATSNVLNTAGNMKKFRDCLAETRAIARALRILSGCSYTAVDELDRSDFKNAPKEMFSDTIQVQSVEEMLNASKPPEAPTFRYPVTRDGMIKYLEKAKAEHKGAAEVIISYLDQKNAVLLQNLSQVDLTDLMGKVNKIYRGA